MGTAETAPEGVTKLEGIKGGDWLVVSNGFIVLFLFIFDLQEWASVPSLSSLEITTNAALL